MELLIFLIRPHKWSWSGIWRIWRLLKDIVAGGSSLPNCIFFIIYLYMQLNVSVLKMRFQMFLFLYPRNKLMDLLFFMQLPFLSRIEQKTWLPLFYGSCTLGTSEHCRDAFYVIILWNYIDKPNSLFKIACKASANTWRNKMCFCWCSSY